MRFTVDPWDPTYGTSVDAELRASTAKVDENVETPSAHWTPLPPSPGVVPPTTVLFVDGVRRVDAQVWVDEGDGSVAPGLFASYAAGAVCCCTGDGGPTAHLADFEVRHGLITGARDAESVVTTAATYRVVTPNSNRPAAAPNQVLSAALQADLARAEVEVAVRARQGHPAPGSAIGSGTGAPPDDLLVLDGPLRGPNALTRAIGYVKSHRASYLPAALGPVVSELAAGQRTPVFRIEDKLPVYSWYLRLPGASPAPWAGVVRVECGGELSATAAVALADLAQVTLVRYASAEYKDSRAPQNLYPIAGLERLLRRRLGEPAVLYRALRAAATPLGTAVLASV